MAHEVRNPLFGLTATLDAFTAHCAARGEGFTKYLDVLRSQVDRIARLMSELIEYCRPQALKLEPDSVVPAMQEAIAACRPLAGARGVAVELRTDASLPAVDLDRVRLAQVFRNLVENAVQHAPAGGVVRVIGAHRRGTGEQDDVAVRIEDNGAGFRAAELERVFEPFYSTRPGGVGLGLALVQRLVLEHRGQVRAFNRLEGGAAVEVTLPASRREA